MYHNHLNIGFRPIDEKDVEILRKLRNDMSTFLNLGTAEMSHSEDQYNWWKNHSFNSKNQRYTLVEKSTNKILGILRILNIDNINSNCEIGVDILPEENYASDTVTAIKLPKNVDGKMIVKQVEKNYNIVLGGGQQKLAGKIIRVGHMGWINQEDIEKSILALKETLDTV